MKDKTKYFLGLYTASLATLVGYKWHILKPLGVGVYTGEYSLLFALYISAMCAALAYMFTIAVFWLLGIE